MRKLALSVLILFLGLCTWFAVRHRSGGLLVKDHYTKFEYRIPMRDGVTLFTQVYVPKDTSRAYPFLITRTPYSIAPYGPGRYREQLGPTAAFDRSGYIFVFQDVRGRYQSGGQFVEFRPHLDHPSANGVDESTDMYDTVEWLLHHVPGHNGKVGVWGVSYAGFYTSASIINTHPAIKAASPEAPVTNLAVGDDAYHNGAFMLSAMYGFYSGVFKPRAGGPEFPPEKPDDFSYGTEDGYKYFLEHGPQISRLAETIRNPYFDQTTRHNTYDDYWKSRNIADHLSNIHCAVLVVGGWFDSEDEAGTLRTFHAIDQQNPGAVNVLAMGPWAHGGWQRSGNGSKLGTLDFGSPTVEYYREHIVFPFFEHYLKNAPVAALPKATVFETGSNRWITYDVWPPSNAQAKTIYLRDHGRLSFDPPGPNEAGLDQYISDPANPVPYIEHPTDGVAEEYMYSDQRFAASRRDVLTYSSEPLTEDVTIAGPILPRLQVSTSTTDSDFDVKLIDGYPEGVQQLVRGEPMRAKFRNSLSTPSPMIPGQVTALNFAMPDANHTFRRGHRIIVQIASSWFPLTDLNPQTFTDIAHATTSDFVKATERIYHQPGHASGIVLQVMPKP